ncbi:MAG TPA: redox-regulated ATPase YchF [Candidatus Dormibacteraeota bacterium]|jgi:GTP-binding protein YchF|nr:redox-regulated ATPase YchF [Candidatus Dormibacteraeota bacterium]
MGLSVGIVGLPNAGKSTLFNALTKAGAAVGNYPFTTIEPNTGIVPVSDPRLQQLADIFNPPRVIPTAVTFTDIAGLVRGASQGEGLGNQFLGHIRETDAIALVVRCFDDGDVTHVEGSVDPVRDIDLLELELQLADLDSVTKRLDKTERTSRLQKEKQDEDVAVLRRVRAHLDAGNPVRTMGLTREELAPVRDMFLLTAKPILVVANVDENDPAGAGALSRVSERAERSGGEAVAVSARIEAELSELEPDDQREFLSSLGLSEPGLNRLARSAYHLLDLITFFTAGEKEVRAWTVRRGETAIDAAGEIHTDFAKGFIRAEVVGAADLVAGRSYAAVREQGRLRLEGRDYVVQDGDVMHFRFNV